MPEHSARLGESSRALLRDLVSGTRDMGNVAGVSRATGTCTWLTILVEFTDVHFPENYTEDLDPLNILGQPDEIITTSRSDWFANELSHVNDYFRTVSHDNLELDITLWDTPVRLSGTMAAYGAEGAPWSQLMREIVAEVVDSLDADIDFAAYDLISIIHAGPGQESDLLQNSTDQIWSGYIDYESLTEAFTDSIPTEEIPGFPGVATNDDGGEFVIRRFGILPEKEIEEQMDPDYVLGSLGVYVHQVASYLGLVSLNDYTTPRGQGAGNFDLMSSGLWNALGFVPGPPSAFNRMLMGWEQVESVDREDCISVSADGGLEISIPSFEQRPDSVLFKFPISDREYFLVANRNQDADGNGAFTFSDDNGNHMPNNAESLLGAEFDYYTTQANASDQEPGSGLYIWRIDEEMLHLTFIHDINLINAYNDHYGVLLLEADGASDLTEQGFGSAAYGSDFDAFRSGANNLPATQTFINSGTYPNTRTAEGATSGWSFHSIGGHGPRMNFISRWEPDWESSSVTLSGVWPAGDPLMADLAADDAERPEFAFLAVDSLTETTYVFVYRDGISLFEPDVDHPLGAMAVEEGYPAGSPVAGDLDGDPDGDGLAELVVLMADGSIKAWTCAGGSWIRMTSIHTPDALNKVTSASVSPILFDIESRAGEVSLEPGLEILVAEHIPGGGDVPDSTCLHWFDMNGDELQPADLDSHWPFGAQGAVMGEMTLGFEVTPNLRGYDHPEPDGVFVNACLVDTIVNSSAAVHRVQCITSAAWSGVDLAIRELPFAPGGDDRIALASGDLDGDGCDELLIETSSAVLFWYPGGRFSGDSSDETLFIADDLAASTARELMMIDLNGDGALEALAGQPSELAAWGAEAVLISDWPISFPQTAPSPANFYDPALWCLFIRDDAGCDRPVVITRDGRLLEGKGGAETGDAVFIGGNIAGRPVLCLPGEGDRLELHGLSTFELITGVSSAEDTLFSAPRIRYWQVTTDWDTTGATGWLDLAADAAGAGRMTAANSVNVTTAGGTEFTEAYAYPNPATESVTWRVNCAGPDHFTICLYDLEGQKRLELEGSCDGINSWERESRLVGLASGVYLYTIHSDDSDRKTIGRLAIIR
ncbi:MAG: hypothetical protein GY835_00265 [bacterium]|nr:hypothetical protein [bacterium]